MSFSITLFGPKHYWWKNWAKDVPRVWFHRPNEHSTGGIGFCIPGIHVVLHYGRK